MKIQHQSPMDQVISCFVLWSNQQSELSKFMYWVILISIYANFLFYFSRNLISIDNYIKRKTGQFLYHQIQWRQQIEIFSMIKCKNIKSDQTKIIKHVKQKWSIQNLLNSWYTCIRKIDLFIIWCIDCSLITVFLLLNDKKFVKIK